jgi:hypothetical protein
LVELGNCVTHLRELHPHTKASIGVYPEDPAEFIHDFPGRYTADAMQVEYKVVLEQLQQISMITSCRKTNKKLLVATSDLDVALPSKRPSNHLAFATKPPATHEQNFMHPQNFMGQMMQQFMGTMMRNMFTQASSSNGGGHDGNIVAGRAAKRPLALMDGSLSRPPSMPAETQMVGTQLEQSVQVAKGEQPLAAGSTVDDQIDAMLGKVDLAFTHKPK